MKKQNGVLQYAMVYMVTGITLAGYSIIQKGTIDVYRILIFWLQLTPIIIIVLLAKWIYEDAQSRSIPFANIWSLSSFFTGLLVLPIYLIFRMKYPPKKGYSSTGNKKEIDKGFKTVVFSYIVVSIAVGVLSVFIFLLMYAKKTGLPLNPFVWVRTYREEDQAYKKSFENSPPPEILSIGGMGPNADFRFVKTIDRIPDTYQFERKDIRGFRIYVEKSSNVIQVSRPKQYTQAVVENVDHWIALYEDETNAK